jgi:hypothetical protein
MRISNDTTHSPAARLRSVTVIALVALLAVFATGTASYASVGLGTAEGFAVLAGQSVTNTGSTVMTGDIGIHPGATDPPNNVTGSGSITLTGTLHDGDAIAEQAKADLVVAYDDAAGRTADSDPGTELGGQTLVGGVYGSDTLAITGTLTLDAGGDPDTVWVFQAASTLITASDSRVELVNGAEACNVFWQVGSSATLGTDSSLVGTVMALTSITLDTNATVEGRALARNGSVTMDSNTITNAACTTPTDDTTTVIEPDAGDDTTGGSEDEIAGGDDTAGDDTTGNGDDTTGDDTPGTDGTDDAAADGDTTGQVRDVPSGAVAAGGGPADTALGGMSRLLAVVLMLVAIGGTVGVAARRRVRV